MVVSLSYRNLVALVSTALMTIDIRPCVELTLLWLSRGRMQVEFLGS